MNRYVTITVICLASCVHQPKQPAAQTPPPPVQIKNDTLLWIRDPVFEHDTDYVRVSYKLESDTLYNRLLTAYIANYRYGGVVNWPRHRLDSVVSRPSFISMILLFKGRTPYQRISYNQEVYHLDDFGDALLFPSREGGLTHFYVIADTLLTQDNFEAVESLWDKADLRRLPSFEAYVHRIDTGNFMRLADLAAFFHNQGSYARRDSCMAHAKKLTRWHKEYLQVTGLFAKRKPFSFLDYNELLYNDHRY